MGEFDDLMPHLISVTKSGGNSVYGKATTSGTPRQYRCLIDDTTTTVRNAGGIEVTVALTAYVNPVPVGSLDGLPVDIKEDETVQILSPRPETRTLVTIQRHYYSENGVGTLHNITLRFS